MSNAQADSFPDLIDQIPDPDIVRSWLASSIRRCDLLRSLLRVAIRKAAYRKLARDKKQEVVSG